MIRGTTPDLILTVDADLTGQTVFVTLSQAGVKTTISGDDLSIEAGETSVIALRLTQEQTLGMRSGTASVQVRMIDENGIARATEIRSVNIAPVLWEKVISYGG